MEKILNYRDNQLNELKKKYNPDLWWFDGIGNIIQTNGKLRA